MADYRAFLLRQLEDKIPGELYRRYPNLPFANGTYLPGIADLPSYAEYVTRTTVDEYGEAAFYNDEAEDIPLVSVNVDEKGYKVASFILGARWSISELEKAQAPGVTFDPVRARLTVIPRGIEEKKNKFLLAGDARRGITGFLNEPNTPSTNSSYNPNTATASDSLDFLHDVLSGTADRTNMTSDVAYIFATDKLIKKWANQYITGTSDTVLDSVLRNYAPGRAGQLRGIIPVNEMKAAELEKAGVNAVGTNKDMVMTAPIDPRAAYYRFNAIRQYGEVEYENGKYIQAFICDVTQPIFDFPQEFERFNITKLA